MLQRAIVGVDLGGTKVSVGRVLGQQLERQHQQQITAGGSEERVLEEIFAAIDQVFEENVSGIGCCVTSLVDVERGIVYVVENIPSWQKVYLKDRLQKRYRVPAYINNDANAFALGELHFGQGRGYRNMVGMTLGTGLGAGIIIDGRLYCGANCGAGEIGAIPYKQHTVEFYCAGQFFREAAGEAGEVIFERAQQGDAAAIRQYEAYGYELGHAVMIALYAYDPEAIVLGGSISKAFPLFEDGMRKRLKSYDYQHALERTVITPSQTENVALLGAAALCLDALGRES